MIKQIEEAGKFFIPKDYMQELRWYEGDDIQMFLRPLYSELVLKKLTQGCVFCDSAGNLVRVGRLCVCLNCVERLKNAKPGDFLYPV
ncbi:MAG: hypothetical protein FWE74_06080 [Oscillospiraceae bacterium]|nr:hypothetical protein [Oscillospiraceae bacterium]